MCTCSWFAGVALSLSLSSLHAINVHIYHFTFLLLFSQSFSFNLAFCCCCSAVVLLCCCRRLSFVAENCFCTHKNSNNCRASICAVRFERICFPSWKWNRWLLFYALLHVICFDCLVRFISILASSCRSLQSVFGDVCLCHQTYYYCMLCSVRFLSHVFFLYILFLCDMQIHVDISFELRHRLDVGRTRLSNKPNDSILIYSVPYQQHLWMCADGWISISVNHRANANVVHSTSAWAECIERGNLFTFPCVCDAWR